MRRPLPTLALSIDGPLVRLLLDGEIQSILDTRGLADLIPAPGTLAGIALAERPDAARALVIGVGLGADVRRLRAHGVRVLAVEIDPRVARLARHFGAGAVMVADGREAWKAALLRGETFDLVLVDACTGPGLPPHHLWTARAVAELVALVSPRDGAVLVRAIAAPGDPACEEMERAFCRRFSCAAWQGVGIAPGVASRIACFSSPMRARRPYAMAPLAAAVLSIAACSAPPPHPVIDKPPAPSASVLTAPIASAVPSVSASASAVPSVEADAPPDREPMTCPALPSSAPPPPPSIAPATDGSPGIRVVGYLLQEGGDLVIERISTDIVPVRYTLRGAAAEPLRKLVRDFQDRAEQERVRAWQEALGRAVGCHWYLYAHEFKRRISPVIVSLEGWSRSKTSRLPEAVAAGFHGELEVTRVRLTRTAGELGPPRAYLGWGCVFRNKEGKPPPEPIADELRQELLEPSRPLTVFGYLSKGPDGRYFLDAPHHAMGGVRFVLTGKELDRVATGPFFTQGDLSDDATPEQMARTLADLVGGGGVKRSNLRFSATAVLVHGRARRVVSIDPDNMARGEKGYHLCPSHPDLPEGGELYEMALEGIDWSLTKAEYDLFVAKEVKPRLGAIKAALARRKPAEALAAVDALAAAYTGLLPIQVPSSVHSGLLQASVWIHKGLAKPAKRPEDALLLPLAVLVEGAASIEFAQLLEAKALKAAIEEYVAEELERITGDTRVDAKVRERAASAAAAMSQYEDETKPLIRRLKKIGAKAKGEPQPLRDLLGEQ